jgi:hypothetical protein
VVMVVVVVVVMMIAVPLHTPLPLSSLSLWTSTKLLLSWLRHRALPKGGSAPCSSSLG